MTTPIPPQVPPGWYQDPERGDAQRYWDGGTWTNDRRPLPPPAPGAPPPFTQPFAPGPPGYVPGYGYGYGQAGSGPVPEGMFFDPQSGVILPEGVQLASVGRRIGAYFLAVPLAIGTLVVGYIIWGLIVWGRGQTPALQVLGMRCWRPEDKHVAGWGWMALRELIGRLIEFIPIFALISLIIMLTSRDRKCLHDYVAGTVVIHDPNKVLANRQVQPG